MPITHDGISGRIPPNPLRVLVGLALLGGGGALAWRGPAVVGVGLALVGLLLLLNQVGERRIRVIESKLLVEDTHLLTGLLIGPSRNRIEWDKVKAVRVDKGALRLDTDGAPFVTAQGVSAADLEHIRARSEAAWNKARANAG